MVEYITGVPGSGKSYRGIFSLFANFGLEKSKIKYKSLIHDDVDYALTNINEIKLDKFENDKVKHLDWDIFYSNLKQLHTMYKAKATDTEMEPIAKELGFFRVLIILDECHNYLDRQDAVLVWWLSYHRHFHQQIYLITQNLGLVNSKYKAFSEFFYKARPSSLKLFNKNMVYFQFTDSRMSQKSKSGTIKLPIIQEVFDSYGSGANQQSQNILKKFLIIAIGFFITLFIVITLIRSYWAPTENETKEPVINSQIINGVKKQIATSKTTINETYSNKDIYKIYCNDNICLINNNIYENKYINFLKKHFEFKIVKSAIYNNFAFDEYQLFISQNDFNKLFNVRSIANENNSKNNNTVLPKLF
jgi:zona occludens toxin